MTLWNKMDRNTLLAFLLISVVLIFTPKYMDLVSPPSNNEDIEVLSEANETQEQIPGDFKTEPLLFGEEEKKQNRKHLY